MESLEQRAELLIEEIKAYSESQKKKWQRIPYLATEAYERREYDEDLERAFMRGYWALDCCAEKYRYQVYVDLATGELIDTNSISNDLFKIFSKEELARKPLPAKSRDLIKLVYNIDQINADLVIKDLEKRANATHPDHHTQKQRELWREKLRKEYGIKKVYVRG